MPIPFYIHHLADAASDIGKESADRGTRINRIISVKELPG